MIQVYTGSTGRIDLTTYQDGLPVSPDTEPTVVIVDAESGDEVSSGEAILIDTSYPGDYYYMLPSTETQFERVLKVTWEYLIDSNIITNVEYVYVITPYATIEEIISELGFSSRPENPNYFSYEKIASAEAVSRMMIDTYLGFSIAKKQDSLTAYGTGTDVLLLPNKIISVYGLSENNQLMIDYINDHNIFGYDVEVTETGYAIRIIPSSAGLDIYESERPSILGGSTGRFRDGYLYKVTGIVGWNFIPREVKQATFLLVNDLLCNDSIWRTRYINKINNGQMSVELSGLAHSGTGNAIVDAILNKFRMIQAVVI